MTHPPTYTADHMESQIKAWHEAADALEGGQPAKALALLVPEGPDSWVVAMTAALCVIGVELIAVMLRRMAGAEEGEPIGTEALSEPGAEPAAVTRLAVDLVQGAAGSVMGSYTAVAAHRVSEWLIPPGGSVEVTAERSAQLLAELLTMFTATRGAA